MKAQLTFHMIVDIREDQSCYELAKEILARLQKEVPETTYDGEGAKLYDPSYGDDVLCECGHEYYRHFDTYEDMRPVGCKYCHGDIVCLGFKRKAA